MKRERESWWDWRAKRNGDQELSNSSDTEAAKRALEKLVERCVVLDNLSPVSSIHTIRTALEQFGKVCGIRLWKDCQTGSFTGIAFVEMESKEQREQVVKELRDYLLMIGQMPRPARAVPATPELMLDHPLRASCRKLTGRLVTPKDPRWKEFEEIAVKESLHHVVQNEILQRRREEEAKLERAQERQFLESIDKLKMLEGEKNTQPYQMVKGFYEFRR